MSLVALGINHESADLSLREKLAFAPEQLADAMQSLSDAVGAGAVILSTCNRCELLVTGKEEALQEKLLDWLASWHRLSPEAIATHSYCYQDKAAMHHLVSVASGLDSMVLGEPQILGQMKSAYAVAREAGSLDAEMDRMFQHCFAIAKKVRTETGIGASPVSVAYAAVNLTRHIFAELGNTTALLIGAGETIELAARHLKDNGVGRLLVANRTLSRAEKIVHELGAEAILLSEVPEMLHLADIVIASTASQLPILGKGAVEAALKHRKRKPMLMVDIAVPRDIEPQVGKLRDVYLYTVDDLREIVDEGLKSRQQEAVKADEIIASAIEAWVLEQRSQGAVNWLRQYRQQAEQLRDAELEKALRQLENGTRPEEVLSDLARNITNKLIHTPSVEIKKAGAEGDQKRLSWARRLLGLDEEKQTK